MGGCVLGYVVLGIPSYKIYSFFRMRSDLKRCLGTLPTAVDLQWSPSFLKIVCYCASLAGNLLAVVLLALSLQILELNWVQFTASVAVVSPLPALGYIIAWKMSELPEKKIFRNKLFCVVAMIWLLGGLAFLAKSSACSKYVIMVPAILPLTVVSIVGMTWVVHAHCPAVCMDVLFMGYFIVLLVVFVSKCVGAGWVDVPISTLFAPLELPTLMVMLCCLACVAANLLR